MFALGFVSVFDQIIEGIPGTAAADIFQAYMAALQEDPEKYRRCSAAGMSSFAVVGTPLGMPAVLSFTLCAAMCF